MNEDQSDSLCYEHYLNSSEITCKAWKKFRFMLNQMTSSLLVCIAQLVAYWTRSTSYHLLITLAWSMSQATVSAYYFYLNWEQNYEDTNTILEKKRISQKKKNQTKCYTTKFEKITWNQFQLDSKREINKKSICFACNYFSMKLQNMRKIFNK